MGAAAKAAADRAAADRAAARAAAAAVNTRRREGPSDRGWEGLTPPSSTTGETYSITEKVRPHARPAPELDPQASSIAHRRAERGSETRITGQPRRAVLGVNRDSRVNPTNWPVKAGLGRDPFPCTWGVLDSCPHTTNLEDPGLTFRPR